MTQVAAFRSLTPGPPPFSAMNSTPATPSLFSDEALADAIGRADAIVKGAEAELATLKDEFKSRGLVGSRGRRIHGDGVRTDFGPDRRQGREGLLGARYSAFEKVIISTVIRIKAANRLALAA